MRIGIDVTPLPPRPVGAGNYIIQLVRSLSALETEHEFVVFAQPGGREMIGLPEQDRLHWVMAPAYSPARRLLWEQAALPALARRAGIDLLHSTHYTRPARLACRSVVTFHDMTFFLFPHLHTRAKRIFFPRAIRYSARHADAIVASSNSTRRDILRILGTAPEKVTTVPLGVTPDYRPVTDTEQLEEVRQKYSLPEEFVLYVGLVEPRKNLPMLLRAYRAVLDQGCQVPLVIVGRFGWMYEEVLHLVDSLGLKEKVRFSGYVPAEDLPIVYNLAAVFVYPSIYEGFGLPPLEALACGTPVITTAVSSIPEHVGQAGILTPPGDEQALSQAILSVMEDPEYRLDLATKGPPQAALFTWTRTAKETLQVYQHVLAKP